VKRDLTLRDLDGKVLRLFTTSEDLDFTTPTDDISDLAWSQDYVYRDAQLLATARVDGAGETEHHFHLNHLGTPLLITDEEGDNEALPHSYFPFGEEIATGADTERMKYTGTYLGSYSGRYGLYGGTVYMQVTNTSAAASALRPPVLGYTGWWQKSIDPGLNDLFASGPMSATSQTFVMSSPCP